MVSFYVSIIPDEFSTFERRFYSSITLQRIDRGWSTVSKTVVHSWQTMILEIGMPSVTASIRRCQRISFSGNVKFVNLFCFTQCNAT